MDWDPAAYDAFAELRARPFLDLVKALPPVRPVSIVDAGCGTAPTTDMLAQRYPEATVLGVDSSAEMLGAARPGRFRLIQADILAWHPGTPVDLVIANAVLHWIADPERAVAHLASWVAPGGVLAFQVPANHDAPSHRAVAAAAAAWPALRDVPRGDHILPGAGYAAALPGFRTRCWDHVYDLPLQAPEITRWLAGTTMRPHLARLDSKQRGRFMADVEGRLSEACPGRSFPFRRRFVVAQRE